MQELNSKFDQVEYNNSLTAVHIRSACKQYNWECQASQIDDYSKHVVDTFDFNGDGRLNVQEFILAVIVINKESMIAGSCKKNCFDEIIAKLVPIFKFLDCKNEGIINAEKIWIGMKNLKRPNAKYDIYGKCDAETGSYRTTTINDFVLKNMKKKGGALYIEEFVSGVLLGFWARQTDKKMVYKDDSRSLIDSRWKQDGMLDSVCQQINVFTDMEKSKKKAFDPFSSDKSSAPS